MSIKEKFFSRKFIISMISIIVSAVALFCGFLTGTEWITAQTIVFGLYGTSNIATKVTEKKDK